MQTQSVSAPRQTPAALVSVDGRTYPLVSAHLEARAEGGMALSTLRQHFRNPHGEALEVVYTMPLPADGAVLGYTITMGERRIEGVVRSREAAVREYREALYQGRTAGLLEQQRPDTFTQTLGNIPGGTDVAVEIRVLHPLAFRPPEMDRSAQVDPRTFQHPYAVADLLPEDAHPGAFEPSWEYRFPTVTGVRYMGAPGQVPDAERLSPDRARHDLPPRITVEVEVADLADPSQVTSPSHPISTWPVDRRGRRHEGVVIEVEEGEALDRDVVIQWSAAAPEVGVRLVEGGGLEGDDGRYALVTVLPPTIPHATVARDVTVLLDTSGSMSGTPLELGKQVIEALLETLDGRDRFELLTFGARVGRLTRGMVSADESNITAALERLRGEVASGHTDMQAGVEEALRPLREDGQRQVVLVTDGYVGFEDSVIASVLGGMSRGVRFHAVGVGAAPNRSLTGGLARAGRGVELFAVDLPSAFGAASHLVAATRRPVLTELRVTGSGVVHSAPARPRDVLAGQPLVLTTELSPRGGSVVVEGVLAGRPGIWRHRVEVAPARAGGAPEVRGTTLPVGALHGREVIADLELEEAAGAEKEGIRRSIEAAGLRHRIVSRHTSLVAVSSTPTVDPRDPTRRETLAVELPAGVSAAGLGLLQREAAPVWGGGGAVADAMPRMTMAEAAFDFEDGDAGVLYAAPPAPVARKRGGPPALFRQMEAPTPGSGGPVGGVPDGSREVEAEVVLHTPERLVVEFQVPRDGFMMPRGEVTLGLPDGQWITAVVDPGAGTQTGPHRRGLRVRLTLVAPGGGGWPSPWPVLDAGGAAPGVLLRWGAGAP